MRYVWSDRRRGFGALGMLLVALSGCYQIVYTVYGRQYSRRDDALKAGDQQHEALLRGIQPLERPVGGQARIILPDDAARRGAVKLYGRDVGASLAEEMMSYNAEFTRRFNRMMAGAIDRRRIFDGTIVQERGSGDGEAGGSEFVITVTPSAEGIDWELVSTRTRERRMVAFQGAKVFGFGTIATWLDEVQHAAEELASQDAPSATIRSDVVPEGAGD